MDEYFLSDNITLAEIPEWQERLITALARPDGGRGLEIHFLPFIHPDGSAKIRVWSWCAKSPDDKKFLSVLKKAFPKAEIEKRSA
jgi:hypothetical protein